MKRRWIQWMVAATMFVISGWGTPVRAQQSSQDQQDSSSQNQQGDTDVSSPEQLRELEKDSKKLVNEDVASIPGSQKLKRAQSKIESSKSALQQTQALLKKARSKDKDIVKINCINDKIAAIKGFLKVSEQSYAKLKEAVDEGDTEASNHHYTLIAVSAQKAKKLRKEANLCVGEVQRYAEGTKVDRTTPDDVPEDPDYLTSDPTETGVLPELTPVQ